MCMYVCVYVCMRVCIRVCIVLGSKTSLKNLSISHLGDQAALSEFVKNIYIWISIQNWNSRCVTHVRVHGTAFTESAKSRLIFGIKRQLN